MSSPNQKRLDANQVKIRDMHLAMSEVAEFDQTGEIIIRYAYSVIFEKERVTRDQIYGKPSNNDLYQIGPTLGKKSDWESSVESFSEGAMAEIKTEAAGSKAAGSKAEDPPPKSKKKPSAPTDAVGEMLKALEDQTRASAEVGQLTPTPKSKRKEQLSNKRVGGTVSGNEEETPHKRTRRTGK